MATPGRVPRIAGWRWISLYRRPLTKKALRRFTFRFVKEEIELASGGVGIHLLVPSPLFAPMKPLDDAPVFCRGQAIDSSLDLLNSAHTWSLSPSPTGFRWKRATPASMARLTQLVEAIHAARGFRDRGLTVAPCHAPVARRATLG